MGIFYTNAACMVNAAEKQAALALSKVRLFKSTFVPTVSTIKADLTGAEAAYTGYTAGGETITAWLAPLLDPAGGASITAPTVQFDVTGPVTATDIVGGFWIEDAAGDVRLVGTFAAPIPMEVVGQGFPLNVKIVEPTGQVVSVAPSFLRPITDFTGPSRFTLFRGVTRGDCQSYALLPGQFVWLD